MATVTEVYDYLRLLYARLGEARCCRCGAAIRQQSPEQILDALLSRAEGTRIMVLAPLVRGRKGEHKEVFESVRKAGLLRARVDGAVVDVDDPPALVRQKSHHIEAVIDRVVVREGVRNRLAESINLAVRHGDGLVLASHEEKRPLGPGRLARRTFQHAICLSRLQDRLRGVGAADLQFQQSLRRLPGLRGPGLAGDFRSGTGPAQRGPFLGRRGDRALERRPGRGRAEVEEPSADVDGGQRTAMEHAAGEAEAQGA